MKFAGDFLHVVRGFLMGGADIIPGVSGGTVALILGIYDRLVTAISHFDWQVLQQVSKRQWRELIDRLDLRFLVALGAGILAGIVCLADLMHFLLEHYFQFTFAAFFGLIAHSSILVARMVARWSPAAIVGLCLAAVFGFWIGGLAVLQHPPAGYLYTFFCGAVGICAMILPGISGAFILLLLGKYSEITGLLRNILHGNFSAGDLLTVAVFTSGCAIGLIVFSKALRWLLNRHESETMAVLCGFMAGSLRRIWPFKVDLMPGEEFKRKQFEDFIPQKFDGQFWSICLIAIVAAMAVLLLDWLTRAHTHVPPLEATDHATPPQEDKASHPA